MTSANWLLHRSPDKWKFYSSSEPFFWSDELNCWITCDPSTITSILKMKEFSAIDYKQETCKLAHRIGAELLYVERTLGYVPLAQEGSRHLTLRKEMAIQLSGQAETALHAFNELAQEKIASAFMHEEIVDVVSEVFGPCVTKLMSELSGICLNEHKDEVSPTQLFDKFLSVNRRKIINEELERMLGNAIENWSSDEAGRRVAMVVLGSDALLGSIGESFVYSISKNREKSMNEIAWPKMLPITAVPYVERVATCPVELAGVRVQEDQRVRVYLDAFRSDGIDHQDCYFGAGRHTCIGKAISQRAWGIVTSNLQKVRKKVSVSTVKYRVSDYVFNCPVSIEVSIDV
ncbi:MAG: hypothetical protein ACREDM_15625 [Methylocella sp.]